MSALSPVSRSALRCPMTAARLPACCTRSIARCASLRRLIIRCEHQSAAVRAALVCNRAVHTRAFRSAPLQRLLLLPLLLHLQCVPLAYPICFPQRCLTLSYSVSLSAPFCSSCCSTSSLPRRAQTLSSAQPSARYLYSAQQHFTAYLCPALLLRRAHRSVQRQICSLAEKCYRLRLSSMPALNIQCVQHTTASPTNSSSHQPTSLSAADSALTLFLAVVTGR